MSQTQPTNESKTMKAGEKRFMVMNSDEISICGFATRDEAQREADEMASYHHEEYHVTEMVVVEWDGQLTVVAV